VSIIYHASIFFDCPLLIADCLLESSTLYLNSLSQISISTLYLNSLSLRTLPQQTKSQGIVKIERLFPATMGRAKMFSAFSKASAAPHVIPPQGE